MTRISPRNPLQVILVERFGGPERRHRNDLGDERARPLAGLVHLLLHALGDLALAVVVVEDRGAVLRADVVSLAGGRGRGVEAGEELADLLLADFLPVGRRLGRLRVGRAGRLYSPTGGGV